MARKLIRVSGTMLFIWFMLAGLILLLAPAHITNRFQFAFARVFRWPLSIGRTFSLSATRPALTDTSNYSAYNNYIANLEKWVQLERRKVEQLSGLRQRFPLADIKFVLADLTTSPDGSKSGFFINRGKNDGLAKGQFVLGENSIIGTIYDVTSHSARVKLITDRECKIAVEIGRLNVRRVMQGSGDNSAEIRMVPTKHKVKTGDKVFAVPQAGYLNDFIVAGEITRCRTDDENPSLWDITVKPVCKVDELFNVVVIIMDDEK